MQSVDFSDDVFLPTTSEEATQKRRQTISNLQEIRESKENELDIKPRIEVTHPSETDTSFAEGEGLFFTLVKDSARIFAKL